MKNIAWIAPGLLVSGVVLFVGGFLWGLDEANRISVDEPVFQIFIAIAGFVMMALSFVLWFVRAIFTGSLSVFTRLVDVSVVLSSIAYVIVAFTTYNKDLKYLIIGWFWGSLVLAVVANIYEKKRKSVSISKPNQ